MNLFSGYRKVAWAQDVVLWGNEGKCHYSAGDMCNIRIDKDNGTNVNMDLTEEGGNVVVAVPKEWFAIV